MGESYRIESDSMAISRPPWRLPSSVRPKTYRPPGRRPPNDHVNRGKSSKDVMPTAMHIAAAQTVVAQFTARHAPGAGPNFPLSTFPLTI
ncbi:MAG TPA: lyase family protein [Bryobacteraceae bacterium]|jgi:hypothetical protein|nr:lyase family protein [Bryobacteraceae bacterium]